jgi:hypothetical protein
MSSNTTRRGGTRPGAGRPRGSTKPRDERRTSTSIGLTPAERDAIEIFKIARGHRSFGEAVRDLVMLGLRTDRSRPTKK